MKNQYGILIKSDRAIEAERCGLVTYSKLRAWQKRAVDRGAVKSNEWHHTSAAANRTYYYNLEDFEDLNPDDFKLEKCKKVNQADLNKLKIIIEFQKMVGGFTVKRKKFKTVIAEGLDVRKKDGIIIGAGGRRLNSNNDSIVYLYKKSDDSDFEEITFNKAVELGYKFL